MRMRKMNKISVLNVYLYNRQIGTLLNLADDKNLFSFNEDYINDPNRPILSLSFNDSSGDLITSFRATQTKLSPFFSNLLPEGKMRQYLAQRAHVNDVREFFLLGILGYDLPGAITLHPEGEINELIRETSLKKNRLKNNEEQPLRFSLAGVQLKFSAIKNNDKGLTIPVNGIGGSWIVKLPSTHYQNVPENEYSMMELARKIGIDVPETMLIDLNDIHGLPKEIETMKGYAYAIKRFDRLADGTKIHIEDFAQVFGLYPEAKYKKASYRNIAETIYAEMGEKGAVEFIKRLVFNILIGNGDMHLKNWSLIYIDKTTPLLAPAYDYISTLPYIPGETLALKFIGTNQFVSLTWDLFKRFADKTKISEKIVINTTKETIQKFVEAWKEIKHLPLNKEIRILIEKHLNQIPLFNELSV